MKLYTISIVVSVYNEEDIISMFFNKITDILSKVNKNYFEIIFINDGSIDKSQDIINLLIDKAELCPYC